MQGQTYNGPGVYLIDCNKCSMSYVGETGRNLETRKKEHARDIRNWNVNSAIANHCWSEGEHRMNLNNSKIIYKSNNVKVRRLIEGVMIDSIPTIEGNKSFSKVDPINLKIIIREAGLIELVRHKQITGSFNHLGSANPQNVLPISPSSENPPPGVDPALGRGFITANGQYLRRSHRLNPPQFLENGDSGH